MRVCFFNKKQRLNQLKEIISINFSIFIIFIKKMENKRISYEKSQEHLLNINA